MHTQEGIEIMADVFFDKLEDVTLLAFLCRGWASPEFIVKHKERIMSLDLPDRLRERYERNLPGWVKYYESRQV